MLCMCFLLLDSIMLLAVTFGICLPLLFAFPSFKCQTVGAFCEHSTYTLPLNWTLEIHLLLLRWSNKAPICSTRMIPTSTACKGLRGKSLDPLFHVGPRSRHHRS